MNGASDSLVPRKRSGIKNDIYVTSAIHNMHLCTQGIPNGYNSANFTEIPSTMYVVVRIHSYVVCVKLFVLEIYPTNNKSI